MSPAQRLSFPILFGLWAALWLACAAPPEPPLEQVYDDGYDALARDDLETAEQLADQGEERAHAEDHEAWRTAFRVLRAELAAGRGRSAEALDLLKPELEAWSSSAAAPAAAPTHTVTVRALMTAGLLHCRAGDAEGFDRGTGLLERAERGASELGSRRLAGEIALRRGTCAFLYQRPAEAEGYFLDALEAARGRDEPGTVDAEAHGTEDRRLEAHAAGSLGLIHIRAGRFDQATEQLERALAESEAIGAHVTAAKTVANLGWCYLELGDYERALPLLTRAADATEELDLPGDRFSVLNNLGRAFFELRRYEEAEDRYARALAQADELGARSARAHVLTNMAIIASKRKRYEEAEALADAGLELKIELDDRLGVQRSRLIKSEILAARGLNHEAEALRRQVIDSPDTTDELRWEAHGALAQLYAHTGRPQLAEEELDRAFALMDASRERLHEVGHRLAFFSHLKDFYDIAVTLLVDTGRPRRALQKAVESRALLIRERLGERALESEVTVERLVELAGASETLLLSYWTTPRRSFLWLVHGDGVELRTLPAADELRRDVEAYRSVILRSGDPLVEAVDEGRHLWRRLVGPVAEHIPRGSRVVIAADDPLHQLSFETLIVPDDGSGPRYWIEDVTTAWTPSLSLPGLDAGPPPADPSSILLIGDPVPVDDDFPRLPHAERELGRLADLFDPPAAAIFTGAEATPSALGRAGPERYAFIHLAAHVTTHREIPLDSAVVLSPEAGGAYKLYARDVLGLPLNARLVTLSACRSAGSRSFAGEGLVGLAWAFMSAGARNVVGGLWDVEDASTAEIMEHLYAGLRRGHDPARALRDAKLRLLRSETAFRKPYYWAPFVVYHGPSGLDR